MYPRLLTLLTILCISYGMLFGQTKKLISDGSGKAIGEFEMLVVSNMSGEEQSHTSDQSILDFNGQEKGEFAVRFQNLNWRSDELEKASLDIEKGQINYDPNAIRLTSKGRKFRLKPNSGKTDIRFEALANGSQQISFNYEVEDHASSKVSRRLQIMGIDLSQEQDNTIDLKAEWKNMDKSDVGQLTSFYEKHYATSSDENKDVFGLVFKALSAHKSKLRDYSKEKGNFELYLKVFPEDKSEVAKWANEKESDSETKEEVPEDSKPNEEKPVEEEAKPKKEDTIKPVEDSPTFNVENKGHNTYRIGLSNVESAKLTTLEGVEVLESTKDHIDLQLKESKNYLLEIKYGDDNTHALQIDNGFKVDVKYEPKGVSYLIRGGESPFRIEFKREGENIADLLSRFDNLIPDENSTIFISNNMMAEKGMEGSYVKTTVVDKSTKLKKTMDLELDVKKPQSNAMIFLIIGLILLLLAGVYLFFKNKQKKKTREEFLEKMKSRASYVEQNNTDVEKAEVKAAPKKITISKSAKKPISNETPYTSSGKMKIKWRETTGGLVALDEFMKLVSSGSFCKLNLNHHWSDSAVTDLYMSKDCITNLGKFLREENLHGITNEMQGAIPEVGGFLMGKHCQATDDTFHVSVNKFVPFVPEYHDVFKIEIGTQTLVQELGDAQDNHPDLDLIGWFHTHPGHGLFLSNSDLSVQKHFPQQYQLAMEIDSLTERLDTAFFTRMKNGKMNNVKDIKEKVWFGWKDIENSIATV